MQIGDLQFSSQLIQAPLAGYSCAPLRKLAHTWGKPAYCCTEMLSAKHIYSGAKQKRRYVYKDPQEGLLAFQLAANDIASLAYACEQALNWGADIIDLNCGCPQPKIRKKHLGSYLLEQPPLLSQLIKTMKKESSVPVTVKIRIPKPEDQSFNRSLVRLIAESGADALIIHGRSYQEDYQTSCHLDTIADLVEQVAIPVIANGDICDGQSAKRMLDHTACAGLMIARASVGQPWLFAQIDAELNQRVFIKPSLGEIGAIFLRHVEGLCILDNEKLGVLQARSLGKYYARGQVPALFVEQLVRVNTFEQLSALVKHFFR